ncbi:MAG: DUF1932 domain-containing protein [Steroidobacteraceae bacterium]
MTAVVAIVAPGSMGAAVGERLASAGVEVLTALDGRSAASRERAAAAGMRSVSDAELAEADFVLSIVPPAAAVSLAERLAPCLEASAHKPVYVDCNAVSPATACRIASRIEAVGVACVDAGIIGMPPRPDGRGPNFYASGPHAERFGALAAYGLEIRVLEGPVGAASALKMSYAGITKGTIAVATAMLLAAMRAGVSDALRAEMQESLLPQLAAFSRTVPGMFPKAYRWVAEMQEIAVFAGADPGAARIFEGAAHLYDRLARDVAGGQRESELLSRFLEGAATGARPTAGIPSAAPAAPLHPAGSKRNDNPFMQ